ncbi:alpha/beta hydrolase [Chryseobacterium defluvii]|nr:alpha/beta hydrolase [Chryseobacterium defluvii]
MMRIFLLIFWLMCTAVFMTGCKKETLQINKDSSFKNQSNISYGKDPEQKMDLYIPKTISTPKEVFVIIHGGGWRGGDKSLLSSFTFSLMEKFPDCAFANINYRLASRSRYALPNQTNDIHSALLFLEKKLSRKPKFILLGNSAGGHLSMLYAYKYDQDKKVKAVINIVGPSNLSDSGFKNYEDYSFVEKHLIDPKIIPDNTSMNELASPVNWITKNSAPTLSFYGTNDTVIPLSQKAFLDSVLHKNEVTNTSFEFNGNHVDWLKEPHPSFLIDKISEFLKQVDQK